MTIRDLVHWNRPFGISVRNRDGFEHSLASFQREMNHLFEHFFKGIELNMTDWDGLNSQVPAIDMIENGDSFIVNAELAGVNPDDVEVEARDGFLTIKGERSEEKKDKDEVANFIRSEISCGYFQRTISLPETANAEKAEATFKNGLLTVKVPKKAEAMQKPKKLQIKKAA